VVCERSKREGSVGEWEVGKRVSPRGVGLSESSRFYAEESGGVFVGGGWCE
jgi:hypothetical protein